MLRNGNSRLVGPAEGIVSAGTAGESARFRLVAAARGAACRHAQRLAERSRVLPGMLSRSIEPMLAAWFLAVLALGCLKVAFSVTPARTLADLADLALPFLIAAAAPVAGFVLAARACPAGVVQGQPALRLCRYGRWRKLDLLALQSHPAYGPSGFIASLLVGILLNVVVRTAEYMAAVPALSSHAPGWALMLLYTMTADLAVMCFFYMVCFVMALRGHPLFPRMLAFAWLLDLFCQMEIARQVGAEPHLPAIVATTLHNLLYGNVQKVMISVAVWLPYLILSERVNVTYRHRTAQV